MSMTREQIEKRYKIQLFLAAYTLSASLRIVQSFMFFSEYGNQVAHLIVLSMGRVATLMLWGVAILITWTSSKRRIFHSKAVIFFFIGVSLWLAWGFFTNFFGLTPYGGLMFYQEFLILAIFVHTVFLSVRIIKLYNLERQIIFIPTFCLGMVLLAAFIIFFNGFGFIHSLSRIFLAVGRDRFAYGFGHYNSAGRLCLYFLIFTSIYKAAVHEDHLKHGNISLEWWGGMGVTFNLISIIAVIILLASASRTSISALILFWIVYYTLSVYQKAKSYIRAMIMTLILALFIILVFIFDWMLIWDVFWYNRGINYTAHLPALAAKGAWLTGVGLIRKVSSVSTMVILDSYYLYVLMQTGVVGFTLLFGTISIFTFAYFHDVQNMTKLQKLTCGLLAVVLYYGFFESFMFGHGVFDSLNWTLIIMNMNDRCPATKLKLSRAYNLTMKHNPT